MHERAASERSAAEARVTVVVVTRDRRQGLLQALAKVRDGAPASPVVVVDNGSTDGTAAAVRGASCSGVEVVEAGRNLGGAGRTLGVRLARTPYVAFNDDDSWWAPGALAGVAACFDAAPRLGLVAARVLVGPHRALDPTSMVMRASPLPPEPDLPGPPVLGFLACGAAVRRDAYLAAGGFHEALGIGGEEDLLALDLAAAGWGLAYVDDVVAHHHPSPVRDPRGRRRRQAANRLLTAWLRRPARVVVDETVRAVGDRDARRGVLDAAAAVAGVLRERHVIDADLERRLQLLETS